METLLLIAAIPFVIELTVLLAYYINRNGKKLRTLAADFKSLSCAAEAIEDIKRENLLVLEEKIVEGLNTSIKTCWETMKNETTFQYTGDFVPQAQTFFKRDELLEEEKRKVDLTALWRCFWLLALMCILLPYGYTFFFDHYATVYLFPVWIFSFIAMSLLWLLFTLFDSFCLGRAIKQYERFISSFNGVIPVAGKDAAFIFEAARKSGESLDSTVCKITDRFDRFAGEDVVPVLEEAIEIIAEKQERGMEVLAKEFSDQLSDTLDIRMTGLAATIKGIQTELTTMQETLKNNIDDIASLISGQRSLLIEATEDLANARESQEEASHNAENALVRFTESNLALNDSFAGLAATVDRIAEENRVFGSESLNLVKSAGELQLQISADLVAGKEKLGSVVEETAVKLDEIAGRMSGNLAASGDEILAAMRATASENLSVMEELKEQYLEVQRGLSRELAHGQEELAAAVLKSTMLFEGIADKMKEAMATAGIEISRGIKDATGDNAEAIEKLTLQAQQLRDDYDSYFDRIDNYAKTTYEELDYHIHSIIARITEDVEKLLKTGAEENYAVLDDYRNTTAGLLTSFNEQADSISLYAKEINLDVSELSQSLQSSVSEFNKGLQESVEGTMKEFDSGLAELALRIANTVASISDAVEALPAALKKE